jgi:hypothetical protein
MPRMAGHRPDLAVTPRRMLLSQIGYHVPGPGPRWPRRRPGRETDGATGPWPVRGARSKPSSPPNRTWPASICSKMPSKAPGRLQTISQLTLPGPPLGALRIVHRGHGDSSVPSRPRWWPRAARSPPCLSAYYLICRFPYDLTCRSVSAREPSFARVRVTLRFVNRQADETEG